MVKYFFFDWRIFDKFISGLQKNQVHRSEVIDLLMTQRQKRRTEKTKNKRTDRKKI